MNGEWLDVGGAEWGFSTPDGRVHARVYRDDRDDDRPWVSWTYHTEGNERYSTVEQAKAWAEVRLMKLLDATESLR